MGRWRVWVFRDELGTQRKWLSDHAYADLVALCQFLPGPASSQVSFALGMMRAGWHVALAALIACLGAVLEPKPNSVSGAIITLLALFLPGFAREQDRA